MSKEVLKLALEAAYLAGFNASGEGYNGEYPFGAKNQNPEHDSVWCKDRDNALEEALAKQEKELALQKLHDENERLGLYKDAYGEENKESVRLQCVVCNTVYADGVPPQVAKQEQGEPVAWGMQGKDGFIFDVICPAEHEREEGGYTTPLYTHPHASQPKQEQSVSVGEPVAWLHWLHGPVRLFLNKDEAMMELDRLNREYPVDKDARQMRPLYTTPQQRIVFPTMLRKMWSGGEVQAWLDENVNKE